MKLVYRSFELTGDGDDPMFNPEGGCAQDCPNYPDCLFDENIPCGNDTGGGSGNGGGTTGNPPCDQNNPNWPDCLLEPGSTVYGASYVINDCGCAVYPDIRAPGGCINVEDTQLGMQPVRRVKVIMKDSWFTQDITYTDDNGCWKMDERYKGRAWMRVQFKNDRCKIRGVAKNWKSIWEWKTTVKDYVGKINGPYFNNIAVNYMDVLDVSSNNHRFWSAATVNNALHEFHDYAIEDGISPPLGGLDVYIARKQTYGYAFMPHFMGSQLTAYAIGDGLDQNSLSISPFGALLSIFTPVTIATQFFPDVLVGTNYEDSDDLKQLAYHEFAHTSHYPQVGSLYWAELVAAEVVANGWGNGTEPDAGRVQIVEGWAEHLGNSYADRTYGLNHSNTSNPSLVNSRRWINLLERDLFAFGHVPIALFHDLIDDNSNPILGSVENGAVTNDGNLSTVGVTGYSNQTIFSQLNSSTTNPTVLRDNLKTILPPNITSTQVDALFSDYGY